jgi:hypothetical protein
MRTLFSVAVSTTITMTGLDVTLDDEHRESLGRGIQNVLSTDLALQTYSQIVDGLPLASVAFDQYGNARERRHPIARHTSLCPGAMETARKFLSEFDISTLDLDDKVSHQHLLARFTSYSVANCYSATAATRSVSVSTARKS